MPLTLLLRLLAPGQDEAEWLLVGEAGVAAGSVQSGPLSLAAAAAAPAAQVVVLVPATQVLLAEPELPPGSGVKIARAVPYALEEQLTEDVDQLVFAIGRRNARGATAVAVVSRQILAAWIAALDAAAIAPAAMYADMSLLSDNPGQTLLWLEGDRLAVRRPDALAFTVEVAPIGDALLVAGLIADPQAELTVADGGEPKPLESVILYVTPEDWARVHGEFDRLHARFETLRVQLLPDGPLPLLARELAANVAVNLLQGEFARIPESGLRWREWRTAAILCLVLLGAHVAAQAIQIHQAERQTAALDTEIARVFAATMPSESMRDARRQMQLRLQRIRSSSAGPPIFLQLMQALSRAVAGIPQTSIGALSFREQMLDMQVTAPNIDAVSHFAQAIGKQGLTAEIQSSTPVAAGVEAHLRVHPANGLAHP